jgi:hypothetical protein
MDMVGAMGVENRLQRLAQGPVRRCRERKTALVLHQYAVNKVKSCESRVEFGMRAVVDLPVIAKSLDRQASRIFCLAYTRREALG